MATVTFGSFPRSGNFFLLEIFRKNASSVGVHWTEHNVDLLVKAKNPFTVMRNPLECVPSWIVHQNDTRPNRAEKTLEWYCSFYQKCFDKNIKIFNFDYLINDPIGLISNFCNVQVLETNFKYFYNETKDKSNYESILKEIYIAESFNKAKELFDKLCVHVG